MVENRKYPQREATRIDIRRPSIRNQADAQMDATEDGQGPITETETSQTYEASSMRNPRFNRQQNLRRREEGQEEEFNVSKVSKRDLFRAITANMTVTMITLGIAIMGDAGAFVINFLLPGLGGIMASLTITPIAVALIWIINYLGGVKTSRKMKAILLLCVGLEFLPVLNALPALIFGVVMTKLTQVATDIVPEEVASKLDKIK